MYEKVVAGRNFFSFVKSYSTRLNPKTLENLLKISLVNFVFRVLIPAVLNCTLHDIIALAKK